MGGDGISAATEAVAQREARFLAELLPILGTNPALISMLRQADTTTNTDRSRNARAITLESTAQGRLTSLGYGQALAFDGAANQGSVPDNAAFSFGSGAADSAFSILALANITDTANNRHLMAKYDVTATLREWRLYVGTTDLLTFELYDESVDKAPQRASDAAIAMGGWHLFVATYAGTGGATAANGIALYQDGAVIASTATNDASYVAMEDTNANLGIGARLNTLTGAGFLQGQAALFGLCAKALSADEVFAMKHMVNAHFGLSL